MTRHLLSTLLLVIVATGAAVSCQSCAWEEKDPQVSNIVDTARHERLLKEWRASGSLTPERDAQLAALLADEREAKRRLYAAQTNADYSAAKAAFDVASRNAEKEFGK